MSRLESSFVVDYRRAHDVHEFELADGMPVTVLSAPTWETYAKMLVDLPDTQGYIVSPELITSPVPLEQVGDMRSQIAMRIAAVQELSRNHSYARLLLGTARFGESEKPQNGVTAFMMGHEIGWQGKKNGVSGEWEYFEPARTQTSAFDIPAHNLQICAELIPTAALRRSERIAPHVRSILVMSCWGVPPDGLEFNQVQLEYRYQGALEQCAGMIFARYTQVKEIVVADRAIVGHGIEPFNAHFKRV